MLFFSSNLQSELFILGSRTGMECIPLRSPPGQYHYHVNDQTKSLQVRMPFLYCNQNIMYSYTTYDMYVHTCCDIAVCNMCLTSMYNNSICAG